MYRELISSLAYTYSLITRGKGIIKDQEMHTLVDGAAVMTKVGPEIAQSYGLKETENDKQYHLEAEKMLDQIQEMEIFLTSLEII